MRELLALVDRCSWPGGIPTHQSDSASLIRESESFSANRILDRGEVTNTATDHLFRSPPSHNPGVDLDIRWKQTEDLSILERPIVTASLVGKFIDIQNNRDGTVKIRDLNGYLHQFTHLILSLPGPLKETLQSFRGGDLVCVGDVLGRLGNVRSKRDHVHYSILDEATGQFLDPQRTKFDPRNGAVTEPTYLPEPWSERWLRLWVQSNRPPIYDLPDKPQFWNYV